jgi:serine protease Do
MKGEVVGINSQIYSRSGGYQGIAFAIPIDVAMDVQSQLRASGKVSRGRIGVMIQEVTKDLADSFGLAKAQGALVASVEKGSPADKAGLEAGDVILRYNDKPVASSSDLPRMVGNTKPGSRATLQVWRGGAGRELSLIVGEMPDDSAGGRPAKRGKLADPTPANKLGLVLSEVSAEQKKQLGVRHGLVVEEVREGSRGELRQGDVILAMIQHGTQNELRSVEQFNGLLAKLDKMGAITLLVRRGDSQTFVTIKNTKD